MSQQNQTTGVPEEETSMLQWRNTRLVAVLLVLTALAASFGSWGWDLFGNWS
jgi:hypothetical protein